MRFRQQRYDYFNMITAYRKHVTGLLLMEHCRIIRGVGQSGSSARISDLSGEDGLTFGKGPSFMQLSSTLNSKCWKLLFISDLNNHQMFDLEALVSSNS